MNLLPILWLTLDKILGTFGQRQDRLNVNLKGSSAAMLSTGGLSRCASPLLTQPLCAAVALQRLRWQCRQGTLLPALQLPMGKPGHMIWQHCARAV